MIRSAHAILARIEETLGGLLALIIAVGVMVASVLIGLERNPEGILEGVCRYGIVAAICLSEFLLVFALYRALGKHPYAPAVALCLPKLPLWLRPPVSAFWLVHLLFACGFMWAAHTAMATSSALEQSILAAFAAGLSYLAFGYLLNAVATMKPDETFVLRVWSNRLWYAAIISVIVVLLPFTGFVTKVQPADGISSQQNDAANAAPPHR